MSVNESLGRALANVDMQDGPVYAVLDGAHFENLPQQLLIGGFVSRPLYLDRGDNDPQRVQTSPHLVWIDEREMSLMGRRPALVTLELLALIGDRAGAVFWQCPTGGEALYRHLRGINMVLIPADAAGTDDPVAEVEAGGDDLVDASDEADAMIAPEPDDGKDPQTGNDTHSMVLFRHADANVITQLLASMSPDEKARFLGPASLVFASPDPEWSNGTPIAYHRATPGGAVYRGPLRLSETTLAGIEDSQLKASRSTIATYLQKVAPDYTERLSREKLHSFIVKAETVGDRLGFESEYAHGLWALLTLITGGEILTNEQVLGHFESDPRDPEEVLDELYDQITDASDSDLAGLS